jgi:hypothetical protein
LDLQSSQLVLKAGLEWMILGWAAIYVEGRIMTGTLEMSDTETRSEVSGGWIYGRESTINAVADISMGQPIIGIALHIG